jgi:hypothetical protein
MQQSCYFHGEKLINPKVLKTFPAKILYLELRYCFTKFQNRGNRDPLHSILHIHAIYFKNNFNIVLMSRPMSFKWHYLLMFSS